MPTFVNGRESPPTQHPPQHHETYSQAQAVSWSASRGGIGQHDSNHIIHRTSPNGNNAFDTDPLPRFHNLNYDNGNDSSNASYKRIRRRNRRSALGTALLLATIAIWYLFGKWKFLSQVQRHIPKTVPDAEPISHGVKLASRPMLDVDPRPVVRSPSRNKTEKYMAYFPHSGYHNQRISLENALTVARLLNRTLLVPPVWLGRSIPYIAFDKLYYRIVQTSKTGWEHCKDADPDFAMPAECLGGYWDYTAVSWDFLVDMKRVAATQSLVDRWDMSYSWLEESLGLDLAKDMVKIKDSTLYEYRIYDSEADLRPLDKFQNRLDISKLRSAYDDYRLLHFSTLFGTTRLRLSQRDNYAIRSNARASMVFKNEHLDRISDIIRDRLGGPLAYFGIHLRVGDGVFREKAAIHAEKLFVDLCTKRLGFSQEMMALLIGKTAGSSTRKRDLSMTSNVQANNETSAQMMNDDSEASLPSDQQVGSTVKRSKGRRDPHDQLKPLPEYTTLSASPLHKSLNCRSPLHQDERFVKLNTPIFLATDSQVPDRDPSFALFYEHFPCIFTLHDFSNAKATLINGEPIPAFEELDRLRNKDDGVPLAGFFYPLLDAMVAAKGRDMLGTPGSTFSQFSVDVLHRVYHEWPIVEAG